jgi:hypothetical protein
VFELVWDTSTSIVLDLFKNEGWDTMAPGEEKEVRNIPEITLKVSCGEVCGLMEVNANGRLCVVGNARCPW